MSQTIELSNEVYERLEKQALAREMSIPEVIARLVEEIEAAHLAAVFAQLRAEGLIAEPTSSSPPSIVDFKPIKVIGKPLSEVIIEERR